MERPLPQLDLRSVGRAGDPAGGEIEVPNFDDTPGITVTIDLWVAGREALVGVNGSYLVSLELQEAVTSGVAVGTGYLPEKRWPGRIISVPRFEVWNLGGAD